MLRTLFRILLVVALLLGQQAALVHAISHVPGNTAAGAPNPDQPVPLHDCEQCSSYSQLHAVGNTHAALPAVIFTEECTSHCIGGIAQPHTEQFYSARAPPVLL